MYILLDALGKDFGAIIAYLKGDALVTVIPPRTKLEPVMFLSKTLIVA